MNKKELLVENESLLSAIEEAYTLLDPEEGDPDPDTASDILADALGLENDPDLED